MGLVQPSGWFLLIAVVGSWSSAFCPSFSCDAAVVAVAVAVAVAAVVVAVAVAVVVVRTAVAASCFCLLDRLYSFWKGSVWVWMCAQVRVSSSESLRVLSLILTERLHL